MCLSQNFADSMQLFAFYSFQGCVAISGAISGSSTVSIHWIAYQTVSNGAHEKKVSISMWTTGTKCVREDFAKVSIVLKKITLMQRGLFAGCKIEIKISGSAVCSENPSVTPCT